MKNATPRVFKYAITVLAILSLLLLLFINNNLAALADLLLPGSALWAYAVLFGLEFLALGWFWRGLFRGPRHLLLMDSASPEEQKAFAREFRRRMRDNIHIRQAGILPANNSEDDPAYMERCLLLLREKADAEIQQNARRIFLATALSQNGRLDALIVLVSLCRLIWRISSIYNQRPHPREVASLYWTVASSAFLAFSLEELDIATEITVGFGEAFHAMAPAGLTASIPFAGKALHTFTASTIDGAANAYLALRAGIIARNAYVYGARQEQKPSRAAVFREAGAQLLGMSQILVEKVAGAVAANLAGAAKSAACYAGGKTVQAGKDIVDNIGKVGMEIGETAGKVASGTAQAVQTTGLSLARAGGGIMRAGGRTVSAVGSLAEKTATGAKSLLQLPAGLTRKKHRKKHGLDKEKP